LSSNEFAKGLLKEKHIAVISEKVFGDGGEGYARVACTLCVEKLKIAFDRIEQFCNELI
jgi:aspartate/methionine/tyrosine aminotransferase